MTLLLEQLAARWRTEADLLERYGDSRGAHVCRLHATELEGAAAEAANQELNLDEASRESGYSARRLRELISSGEIPQAGRKGAPRIRRTDLPRKPGATSTTAAYDPEADATSLLSRMST